MCFIIAIFSVLFTILEVKLLGGIAQVFGPGNMWLLMIATAFIGFNSIREQRQLSARTQARMMRGELSDPSELMLPLISLLSGILLLIPGPLTDLIGLALLSPPIGKWALKKLFSSGLQAAMRNGRMSGGFGGFGGFPGGGPGSSGGQSGGFGGFGGFGNMGGFGGMGGSPTQGASDAEVNDAEFDPHLGSDVDPDQAAPSREGIHRTQKPRASQWRDRRRRNTRTQNSQSQVIIDVDGEIVDDD